MFKLAYSGQFRKDIKILVKRNFDISLLKNVLTELEINGTIQTSFKPHRLTGTYSVYWEAHIKTDWLLIWKVAGDEIELARTGTHSDLFK
jgi:mRNA interferase YafQ